MAKAASSRLHIKFNDQTQKLDGFEFNSGGTSINYQRNEHNSDFKLQLGCVNQDGKYIKLIENPDISPKAAIKTLSDINSNFNITNITITRSNGSEVSTGNHHNDLQTMHTMVKNAENAEINSDKTITKDHIDQALSIIASGTSNYSIYSGYEGLANQHKKSGFKVLSH